MTERHVDGSAEITRRGSTTWDTKVVRVRAGRTRSGHSLSGAKAFRRLARRERDEFQTVRIRYSGGPTCSYTIHARGIYWRVDGGECLHDIMEVLNNQGDWNVK